LNICIYTCTQYIMTHTNPHTPTHTHKPHTRQHHSIKSSDGVYMYVCIYIRTCMYVYIYVHVCMYIYTYTYVCIYIRTCMQVYVYVHVCMYIHTYMYACIYIRTCMHVYIYVHVCIYTYTYMIYAYKYTYYTFYREITWLVRVNIIRKSPCLNVRRIIRYHQSSLSTY